MTADTILLDPPGLRALGRELKAAAETALELRDRVCVEECSLLPTSSSGLADEVLQNARQRLHALAGSYSTTSRAVVSRAEEVEAAEARWWGIAPEGIACGCILADGTYVQDRPLLTATSSAWGPGLTGTATSSAWGSGLTGTATSSAWGSGLTDTATSSAWGAGVGTVMIPMPSSLEGSGVTMAPIGLPYAPTNGNQGDATGSVMLPAEFTSLTNSGGSGVINLEMPGSSLDNSVGNVGSITMPLEFGTLGDPGSPSATINLPLPSAGIDPNAPNLGQALAALEAVGLGNMQRLQQQIPGIEFALVNGGVDVASLTNTMHNLGNIGNTASQLLDPTLSASDVHYYG